MTNGIRIAKIMTDSLFIGANITVVESPNSILKNKKADNGSRTRLSSLGS